MAPRKVVGVVKPRLGGCYQADGVRKVRAGRVSVALGSVEALYACPVPLLEVAGELCDFVL